jgi:hypothetical protein
MYKTKTTRGRYLKKFIVPIICAFFLLLLCVALADANKYEVVDKNKVYYGNCNDFTRPACLSAKRVFREIPEYRTILRKRLTCANPHYWVLLNAANEVFRKVVKGVALENGYDLIGEQGTIKPKSEKDVVPDATHLALLYLRKLQEK